MTGRVFIWSQHLLGIGHLRRAAALARAMTEAGLEVTLVSGGPEVAGLNAGIARVIQLPPLRAIDSAFSGLATADGTPPNDQFLKNRAAELLTRFENARPDVLMTEMYPFGRRQLAFELMPLLEAARSRGDCPAVCSVRDILTEKKKPGRYDEMAETALRFYDAVLVHGDPAFVGLDATFPPFDRIAHLVQYTGYVREAEPARPGDDASGATAPAYRVIVSAGGGAVGDALLDAALAARTECRTGGRWLLLAGGNRPADEIASLAARAPEGVDVGRSRQDFRSLLRTADVSVSQAGYNTVMDILDAQVRSVLVPFEGEGETEQAIRAGRMAALGWAEVVSEHGLTARELAGAIDRAAARPRPPADALDCNGAERTADIIRGLASR